MQPLRSRSRESPSNEQIPNFEIQDERQGVNLVRRCPPAQCESGEQDIEIIKRDTVSILKHDS